MTPSQEILNSIEIRLKQLSEEIAALRTARAALERRAGAGTPAAMPGPRRRRREKVSADQLEALLAGAGGLSTSELAEQTHAGRQPVLALMRQLERAGRVRRAGERRTTRWYAITDEDRVRQRAAELALRAA